MKLKPKTKEQEVADITMACRRARMTMLANHPFFGDMAMKMEIKLDDTLPMPTAATDGDDLFFHPDFVKKLTPPELVFVMGHEVLHAALQHVQRMGNKDGRWQIATDIVVNQLLVNNQVGKMPKGLIYEPNLFQLGEGSVDKIYDLLKPEDIKDKQPMDDFKPGGKKGNDPVEAAKWRARIQQAADNAKAAGKMPGDIETILDQCGESTVAWEDEIFNEITSDKGEERTYAKRNRRYAALDVLMPGNYGDKTGDLVFAIDCSGSTSDDMVKRIGGEVRKAAKVLKPEKVHILYFDTRVLKHEQYNWDDDFEVHAVGRGGTAFSPVFDYINEQKIDPQHCIVATDLGSDDFGIEPDYPVLWCVMDACSDYAAFGKVIMAD